MPEFENFHQTRRADEHHINNERHQKPGEHKDGARTSNAHAEVFDEVLGRLVKNGLLKPTPTDAFDQSLELPVLVLDYGQETNPKEDMSFRKYIEATGGPPSLETLLGYNSLELTSGNDRPQVMDAILADQKARESSKGR